MLHDGEKLHVGEAHLLDIGGQLVRQLAVGKRLAVRPVLPGACVNLVDVHGVLAAVGGAGLAVLQPAAVVPDKGRLAGEAGGGLGRAFHGTAVGIGAEVDLPVGGGDAVLVDGSVGNLVPGESQHEDAVPRGADHGDTHLPVVGEAHYGNTPCMGGPDAEDHPLVAVLVHLGVSAQVIVGVAGGTLVEQELIQIAAVGP